MTQHPHPSRPDLHREITEQILIQLETDVPPWVRPWRADTSAGALPYNLATGRRYSGINILLLWMAGARQGFAAGGFLTFRQAQGMGGRVRRGEHGCRIVFAERVVLAAERIRAAEEGRDPVVTPILKPFTVFNMEQFEGLPLQLDGHMASETSASGTDVDAIVLATGALLQVGGPEACYNPAEDRLQMPLKAAFADPLDWTRTLLHELIHWTGHGSRLNRDQRGEFGSASYAREELVAELGAAFACAELGIPSTLRHAAYLNVWRKVLRDDVRAIARAATAASKAAAFLLAFRPNPSSIEVEYAA